MTAEHLARRFRVDDDYAAPAEALDQALAAAGGKDVRIGGGPTVVRPRRVTCFQVVGGDF